MSIFVLHGASSAGKTTIGRALQRELGSSCVYVDVDSLWGSLPQDTVVGAKVFTDLTDVLFAQAARWASLGYQVVADTVFENRECVAICARHCEGHDTYLVAVTCSLEVLEQREQARGDRRVGLARGQAMRVHTYVASDLMVDSSTQAPDTCVSVIVDAARVPPGALAAFSAREA